MNSVTNKITVEKLIDDCLSGKEIKNVSRGSLIVSTQFRPKCKTNKTISEKSRVFDSTVNILPPGFPPDSVESEVIRDSLTPDIDYSERILKEASDTFAPDAVTERFRENKPDEGFREGERQIKILLGCSDKISKRTAKYCVLLAYQIGELLLTIEDGVGELKTRKWIDNSFTHDRARYFQQAKQIARMGSFAARFSVLGKNRLLEFDRLRENPKKKGSLESVRKMNVDEYTRIMTDNPLPKVADIQEEEVYKVHIDALITLKRLQEAGIHEAEFEQAVLLAVYHRTHMEKKQVAIIAKQMEGAENRAEVFDRYVMDKGVLAIPESSSPRGESLRGILSRLLIYMESPQPDAISTSEERDMVRKAREYLQRLEQSL